jgi:hypothetical protein
MRTVLLLFLAIGLLVGLASATVVMGTVVSSLGLAFLAMIAVVGLVIAAAGNKTSSEDDAS